MVFFLFPLQINFKKIKRGREPIDENTPRVINHKQCLDNDFLVQKKKQTVGKNKQRQIGKIKYLVDT